MKTKTRRRFTAEFKEQAVALLEAGRPVPELAQDLEVSEGLLYTWARKAREASQLGSEGHRAEGEEAAADELRRLRHEVSLLREENQILKQAAVILGTKAPKKGAR